MTFNGNIKHNMAEKQNDIIKEITPLSDHDCIYVVDRRKTEFNYPVHVHSHCEYELNFIQHAAGVRRIVGDSSEIIGDYDLVLIAGKELEHGWLQDECTSKEMREITVQFSSDLLPPSLLEKNQFSSIRHMLDRAACGLSFSMPTIMKVYNRLIQLSEEQQGFDTVMNFFHILHDLSQDEGAKVLATSSFAKIETSSDSRRVQKVQNYIDKHYQQDIRLADLADLVGMTPVSFSRFFRQRTGKTLSDYITDIRLGFASRLLVDTTQTIAEICYDCGFNNLSNFNRMFKRKKNCSPKEFREQFRKKKVVI